MPRTGLRLSRATGRRALAIATDVTVYAQVEALVARTVGELGGLHAVVNNSGIARVAPVAQMSPEDFRATLDVNLVGVFNGCRFEAGQMVLLSFPAANRDPNVFPDADRVIIDRKENRHAAFGLGIHRCVGSNLARMEIRVALQEWLARIPSFRLDPDGVVKWSEGTVRGPRRLPVLFG